MSGPVFIATLYDFEEKIQFINCLSSNNYPELWSSKILFEGRAVWEFL
jgi:hypothetical protein